MSDGRRRDADWQRETDARDMPHRCAEFGHRVADAVPSQPFPDMEFLTNYSTLAYPMLVASDGAGTRLVKECRFIDDDYTE